MSYDNISNVPNNIRELDGIKLSLEQANYIANIADGIPDDKVKSSWAIAISQFKKNYIVKDGKWIKNTDVESKESCVYIEKQTDGRYRITAISTVALPDLEGEIFTTEAMDYDIAAAYKENAFPEFRMFHRKGLAIGKIDSMRRVGMFAVDSGYSYTDPFSIQVCEKMLVNNVDGKWKISRGFKVLEASGSCPQCGEDLLIDVKHMVVGFRCPSCGNVTMSYKGILKDVQFRKTRTFESTVTDVPAVPWTGVQAFPVGLNTLSEDVIMNKEVIKQKLLDAGIDEKLVDERLKSVDPDVLKSFNLDAIPDAVALKEFLDGEPLSDPAEDGIMELDDVVKSIETVVAEVVRKEVRAVLDGLEIDVDSMDGVEVEVKELPGLEQLKQQVDKLTDAVNSLLDKDEKRLKELYAHAPRNSKLRIRKMAFKEDMEDEEEDDDEEENTEEKELGVIVGADGKAYKSMTELVAGR